MAIPINEDPYYNRESKSKCQFYCFFIAKKCLPVQQKIIQCIIKLECNFSDFRVLFRSQNFIVEFQGLLLKNSRFCQFQARLLLIFKKERTKTTTKTTTKLSITFPTNLTKSQDIHTYRKTYKKLQTYEKHTFCMARNIYFSS